ncbi:MAG: hypothetical protein JST92_15975 [Deltaproteobacteria bacterium]|nr:hypothetical protein [Deltaproteobacteria bacterium]
MGTTTRAMARSPFWWALGAAAVLSAELAVVASPRFLSHPLPLSAAVIADLCLVVPAFVWSLTGSRRAALRLVVVGAALASLLLRVELRLWAAPLELLLFGSAILAARRALSMRESADAAEALQASAVAFFGDHALAHAVGAELSIAWYGLLSWGRTPPAGFSSHLRSGWSAIAFALIVASAGEGLAVHFLLARAGPLAQLIALALHIYAIVWLLGDARALALRRTTLSDGVLRVRLGLRWSADVPVDQIASVCMRKTEPGELALRTVGDTNLALHLHAPIEVRGLLWIRRRSRALALQFDEPQAVAEALGAASRG